MLILAELDAPTFCNNTADLLNLIGIGIMIIKVVIPILLIIFGMLDMGKAVTSGKDDEIKKQAMAFLRRAIAAVVVFFVPTIVGLILSAANSNGNGATDFCNCLVHLKLKKNC